MEKKKASKGIKIICALLIIPIVLTLLTANLAAQILKFPNNKKLELIQLEQYKAWGITNIEEFDRIVEEKTKKLFNTQFILRSIISILLAFGLWNLKQWARIGSILYYIYTVLIGILLFLSRTASSGPVISATFSFLLISIIIIYFLTRPKVKEQFK